MLSLILLLAAIAPVAGAQDVPCWTIGRTSFTASILDPGPKFSVVYGPKLFSDLCAAGDIVTSGTFFSGDEPMGDVIVASQTVFSPHPRRFRNASRRVDVGARWGIGLLKGTTTLAILDGDTARGAAEVYLGGAGLLLKDGADATKSDLSAEDDWGPGFSRSEDLDAEHARTAFGLTTAANGRQTLIVLSLTEPPGASAATAAALLKRLGAVDAVFYAGGGAAAFAAGGVCVRPPLDPAQDLSPTHIVLKACR